MDRRGIVDKICESSSLRSDLIAHSSMKLWSAASDTGVLKTGPTVITLPLEGTWILPKYPNDFETK